MPKKSASNTNQTPVDGAPAYEAERFYRVTLVRPVVWRGLKFLPRDPHKMTGAFIATLIEEAGDVVTAAEPI